VALSIGSVFAIGPFSIAPDILTISGTAEAFRYTVENWNSPEISFGAAAEAYTFGFFLGEFEP
jgi:hypothetical protein